MVHQLIDHKSVRLKHRTDDIPVDTDSLGRFGESKTLIRSYKDRDHIFMAGDNRKFVYRIVEGVVGLYDLAIDGRRQFVAFYYPGDFVGMTCAPHHSLNAVALSDLYLQCYAVCSVDNPNPKNALCDRTVMDILSDELKDTQCLLLTLSQKSAIERLATFLLRIFEKNKKYNKRTNELFLPMSRADIGDYLGMKIETVSRNFTKLKNANAIRIVRNNSVEVLDINLLKEFSETGSQ